MTKLRSLLHLALVLTLSSLTCDVGALCTMAGTDGCCCPVTAGAPAPCTDISGGELPGTSELPASLETSKRFATAILDAAPTAPPVPIAAPLAGAGTPLDVPAAVAPLYLSHCAFLC